MTRKTAQGWSYTAGERGRNRVRLYADPSRAGLLYLEFRDGPQKKRVALGHRDREAGKAKAEELAAALRRPAHQRHGPLPLATLFDNYLREVTPAKGQHKQDHDRRATRLILRLVGGSRDARTLSHREAAQYVAARRRLGDQRRGNTFGRPLGPRQLAYDMALWKAILNWGVGCGWLDRNPLQGFTVPEDTSPRRPLLSAEDYGKLVQVAGSVSLTFAWLLRFVHETGHRIGAVCALHWGDVDLERRVVRWRAGADKIGLEHETPLTEVALEVLREVWLVQPGAGEAWLFPGPTSSGPVSRHLARDWWQRAEHLAKLKPEPGRGWHSFRRKFANELRRAPLKDLTSLGGWKSPLTVVRVYQQPDMAAMREALEQRAAT